ncbi:hypothetical protein ON010_g7257 [Phytophthora cinnamomi]|nr:hypothetical protein ON010_g7257 [Phytophthora cinnamomi]
MSSPGVPGEGQAGDGSHRKDAVRVFEFTGAYNMFASDSESGPPHGSTAERLEPIVEEVIVAPGTGWRSLGRGASRGGGAWL